MPEAHYIILTNTLDYTFPNGTRQYVLVTVVCHDESSFLWFCPVFDTLLTTCRHLQLYKLQVFYIYLLHNCFRPVALPPSAAQPQSFACCFQRVLQLNWVLSSDCPAWHTETHALAVSRGHAADVKTYK